MERSAVVLLCFSLLMAGCASQDQEDWPEPEEPIAQREPEATKEEAPMTKRQEIQFNGTLDSRAMGCWFNIDSNGVDWHDVDPWTWGGSYTVEYTGTHTPVEQPGLFDAVCVYLIVDGRQWYQLSDGQIPDDTERISVSSDASVTIDYELKIWNDVPINGTASDDVDA